MLALNAETVETLRFETPARIDKLGLRRRVLAGLIWRFVNIALVCIYDLMDAVSR